MKYTFGPLPSRRFGVSLGVDLSPDTKRCNFDCLYCELDPAKPVDSNPLVIDIDELEAQVGADLLAHPEIEVITITANGEPTLSPYLDAVIERINAIKGKKQSLILTNSSTIMDADIQATLAKFDIVKCSLDAVSAEVFKKIDRQFHGIEVEAIMAGLLAFRARYHGRLILEILFVKGVNDKSDEIAKLAHFARELNPDRVDLNTVDRAPAYAVSGLSKDELAQIATAFEPLEVFGFANHRARHIDESNGHRTYK